MWEDLPNYMDSRYVESILYTHGKAVMFRDPLTEALMIWKVTPDGKLNWRGMPVKYHAYAFNGDHVTLNNDECVILRNNYLEVPTELTMRLFAHRLYENKRTIDINLNAQKTPKIIHTDKKGEYSIKNALAKIDNNEYAIIALNKFLSNNGVDKIKALDISAPFVADKLINIEHDIWNEVCTFLGINNANVDKRERLITDEVTANEQLVTTFGECMLAARKDFCEQANKLFGLESNPIKVRMRTSFTPSANVLEDSNVSIFDNVG